MRLGDAASREASSFLRHATVDFEETNFHAGKGNCDEALKRLVRGVRMLDKGLAILPKGGEDGELATIEARTTYNFRNKCLR